MENSDDESVSRKDLVPPGWFQKPQDYRLFDFILENIGFIIDELEEKNRLLALGIISAGGGKYKGPIRSTGYFNSKDDLLCKGLSIIGKSSFNGLTIVDGG
ncbi:MAG: hypothetical protein ACXAC2_11690, partial [Candidatus Kariarchaeaceae archaeon]